MHAKDIKAWWESWGLFGSIHSSVDMIMHTYSLSCKATSLTVRVDDLNSVTSGKETQKSTGRVPLKRISLYDNAAYVLL